jgi:hypothetical protein
VPFVDVGELACDVLRHAGKLTVMAPASLRGWVRQRREAALARDT